MKISELRPVRAAIFVFGLMLFVPLNAQEVLEESSEEQASNTEAAALAQDDVDSIDPAVSAPELATGVTRRATTSGVLDELDLESTRVTGNQELPKVLYIVPWKQADLGDLVGLPVNTLLDEVLEPVDRDEFKRRNRYYDSLYGDTELEATDDSVVD